MMINDLVKNGELSDQENIHLISPDFLDVFDFKLQSGDSQSPLNDLRQVVITPEIAAKYFGGENPIGKTLTIQFGGEWMPFAVSGVLETPPNNSSVQFDMLISFDNTKTLVPERARQSWTIVYPETYVMLKEGTAPAELKKKMQPFLDEQLAQVYEAGAYEVGFQPITDIHLNNEFPNGMARVSDWRYPYILGGVALLILLLASINFITISVGRSVSRAKEVGVRKVSGATRGNLILQYWSESLLVAFVAILGGVLLAQLLLPLFNQLANQELILEFSFSSLFFLLGLAILIGLVAGSYPALVVSGFNPVKAIKGYVSKMGNEKHVVLRSLVGLQFVLSIGLITCTLIMNQQMHYLQNKNLGYAKDYRLVLPYSGQPSRDKGMREINREGKQKADRLKKELQGREDVLAFTTSTHALGTPGWYQVGFTEAQTGKFRQFYANGIDYDFLESMKIDLIDGRNFSEANTTDATQAVIVNETMADAFNLREKIGQPMPKPFEELRLIGIVKDFNFSSLHRPVEPLAMAIDQLSILSRASDHSSSDQPILKMTINIDGKNVPETMQAIKSSWAKVAPEQPFNFSFIDKNLQQQYESESRLGKILGLGTLLAVFIAGLGLFGIATLTVARRTKEIGIRKVMGASAADILLLLNSRFTRLVLIASVLAAPLAFLLMRSWLADFAYHINLNPLVFLLATVLAIVISWLAVSYHSLRAATTNPVKALRYE